MFVVPKFAFVENKFVELAVEEKMLVVVANVVVAFVAMRLVKRRFEAVRFVVKMFVVVALVPVAFTNVKFWRVEEPAMDTLPELSTENLVVVAKPATLESWNNGAVALFCPATSRVARGDVVPIPTLPVFVMDR